jgi:L-alanine-DL-glutamate epimerase-like enolase superfamily enzyme
MKITDVETILLRLPVVREIGDGCQTICVIRVHTDEGIVGIGEAHTNPLAARAIIGSPLYSVSAQGLGHILIGEDPRDINRLWDKMYKHTQT